MKKEINLNESSDVYDVGAEWERLVGAEVDDPAGVEDGDGTERLEVSKTLQVSVHRPWKVVADSGVAGLGRDMRTWIPPPQPPAPAAPLDVREEGSSSGGSSGGGSPTEKLGGIFETLVLSNRSRRLSATSSTSIPFSDPFRWMPLLRPSEVAVWSSTVYKAHRRTFPRQLLPLPGSAKKGLNAQSKDREHVRLLVLTKTRLLCLKERDGAVVVKCEALIGGRGSGNGVVIGVEEKGEKTFVVQTVRSCARFLANDLSMVCFSQASKCYTYTTEDPSLTSRWVKELTDALRASRTPQTERQPSIES